MVILGIDPGVATLGWGVIKVSKKGNCRVEGYGCIRTQSSTAFPKRLKKIHRELGKIIRRYRPDIAAIEQLFFAKNVKTAITVGEARGVAILSAVEANVPVTEYNPLEVKQSLVGYGRAGKEQMQKMLKLILGLRELPRPDDTADALAVALCHVNSQKMLGISKRGRGDV